MNNFSVGIHLKLAPQVSDLTKFSVFLKKLVCRRIRGAETKILCIFFYKKISYSVSVSNCCDMWSSMLQEKFAVFASVLHVYREENRSADEIRNVS